MNHNLETVPRLYRQARPGSDYAHSLALLREFKRRCPGVPTKSGLMVGLGETDDEILRAMRDMRAHDIDMLTIGQYLQPSRDHLPVARYVHPETFAMFERRGERDGLPPRGRGRAGAFVLSRGPAGGGSAAGCVLKFDGEARTTPGVISAKAGTGPRRKDAGRLRGDDGGQTALTPRG